MPNRNPECAKCPYNIPKTKGGYGKTCNGYTMKEFGRCPEWRINELAEIDEIWELLKNLKREVR